MNKISKQLLAVGGGLIATSLLLPLIPKFGSGESIAALVTPSVYSKSSALEKIKIGTQNSDEIEATLARIYVQIASGNTQQAFDLTEELLKREPNFRLAHLIRGDLLLARTQVIHQFGAVSGVENNKLQELRSEAQKRLEALKEQPPKNAVPAYALKLLPEQKHLLIADMSRSRLYLFENKEGDLKLVEDQYISQGKQGFGKQREGDQRTPIGVYRTTSLIPKEKLEDLYGVGALALDYPNDYDRKLGRTGHGIWLHGVPSDTYSRAPLASDGCVVLSNPHMQKLMTTVSSTNTPVLLTEKIEWVDKSQLEKEKNRLEQAIDDWRRDWENRNHERYMRHYDINFSSEGMNQSEWLERKKLVNASKAWIRLNLSNLSMFKYPGTQDMAVVEFRQNYNSSNLVSQSKKRMYWIKRNNDWKILMEESV